MKDSGCTHITLAPESGSLRVMKEIVQKGNDFGFDHIFSRQIEAIGKKGDLLIAISTSGNSKNIINAIKSAQSKGLEIIIFTGRNGGETNVFDCLTLKAPSDNVARIQENHILVGHIISKYIEENL